MNSLVPRLLENKRAFSRERDDDEEVGGGGGAKKTAARCAPFTPPAGFDQPVRGAVNLAGEGTNAAAFLSPFRAEAVSNEATITFFLAIFIVL
jgi:hypothetical protein